MSIPSCTSSSVEVLFEDNHLIAVFKPANLLTQGDSTLDPNLLELVRSFIKARDAKPGNVFVGMLHRLDRPVSGLVLFAKTSKAASRLSAQFRERSIEKRYVAWVEGKVRASSGRLEHVVGWENNRATALAPGAGARANSLLNFTTLAADARGSLVEIELLTGKKHQIRAQFSAAGHPILGDGRYGGTAKYSGTGIALIAKRLKFNHPVRSEERVELVVPENWDEVSLRWGTPA